MKDINLLVWLTQLGLSTAVPLAGFIFLGSWLHSSLGLGRWTVIAGVLLGVISAVSGLLGSLRILSNTSKPKDEDESPSISFNEHD